MDPIPNKGIRILTSVAHSMPVLALKSWVEYHCLIMLLDILSEKKVVDSVTNQVYTRTELDQLFAVSSAS